MEKISTSQGVGSKRKGEKRERQFESVGRCVCVCALVQKCLYGPWARKKKICIVAVFWFWCVNAF